MEIVLTQGICEWLNLSQIVWIATTFGAFLVAFGFCAVDRAAFDDGSDDDFGDDEDLFDFNMSPKDFEEYDAQTRETIARVEELREKLENATDDRKEIAEELTTLQLGLAARSQEEGDESAAFGYYEEAFEAYSDYVEAGGCSRDVLKKVAAGRLSYAVLLYESGDNEKADEEYLRAQSENEKLIEFGDREARVDNLGIDLNRASIIFARGDADAAFELLDKTIAELKKLVADPDYNRYEVPYCFAKAHMSKGLLLRSTFDDDLDCPEAAEAREAYEGAINAFRALVEDGGETQYRRELADALVESMAVNPIRSREDAEGAIARLKEASDAYRKCVILGESDACVDFFEASLERARLLMSIDCDDAAFALYDSIIEAFDNLSDSDELPLLEGLATAYQNRAKLRKGDDRDVFKKKLADLDLAIDLQIKIADDLVATLREENDDCCCGRDHNHDCGCGGHGHGHDHDCGCGGHGHGHDHDGCCGGHGHEHAHDGCRCGHDHGVSSAERRFFIEHWVSDNYVALMECLFDRAGVHLELGDRTAARADCDLAETITKQYRSVLKEGETLDDETIEQIREMRRAL